MAVTQHLTIVLLKTQQLKTKQKKKKQQPKYDQQYFLFMIKPQNNKPI